ncbi:hypothetical protein KMB89_gp61 [Citrobacter phage HCF1]|uniref:Uncharacterized protein n=1 Tax=Citrobacter phage HCF1 TaxID=2849700 RepID=A0ABX6D3Q3_9CAUD|nr:hypothetical protein KMB89_gp61 [Citrobacter phage HCF1]
MRGFTRYFASSVSKEFLARMMSAKYIDGVKGKYWSRGAMRRPFNFELYSLEGDKTNTNVFALQVMRGFTRYFASSVSKEFLARMMSAKYIDGVKGKYWSRGAMRRPFNFELYSLEGHILLTPAVE